MATIILNNAAALAGRYLGLILAVGLVIITVIIWAVIRYFQRRRLLRRTMNNLSVNQSFNAKECENCMRQLAQQLQQVKRVKNCYLITDLNKQAYKQLTSIRLRLARVSSGIISLIPAARWLFDNYYMLYGELKNIQGSGRSYKNLPVISSGVFKGHPRIYMVAREIISCSGQHLQEDAIVSMIRAYQTISPLTSIELWILPEMLGLCLLESVILIADDILQNVKSKSAADDFIQKRSAVLKEDSDILQALSDGLDCTYASDIAFLSHVLYCLKNMSVDEVQINRWVASMADAERNTLKPSDIFIKEGLFEVRLESTIRALIVSLREINNLNGEELFEAISPIESILKQDPAGIYDKMSFETRNNYRRVVESLALRFKIQEPDVAKKVLSLAASPIKGKSIQNPDHIGTYLIGRGKSLQDELLAGKPSGFRRIFSAYFQSGKPYFFCIALLTMMILLLLGWAVRIVGYSSLYPGSILFYIFVVLPAMAIAIETANHAFMYFIKMKELPCMDFIGDIPDEYRTFVVMPVILGSGEQAQAYAFQLEKYYLANPQSNLYFAVLGDFKDAPRREMPEDHEITHVATQTIQALNDKYPSFSSRFFLFIRYRKWNDREKCWMGWERKRGKLEEFNAMLCGKNDTTFSLIQGDADILGTFKYVITLDADTDLIRDSAAKLAGIMAHPLNRPVIDPATKRVIEGYAIIQPEIRNHFFSITGSRFSRIFADSPGIDPYSTVISDIYQDTFHEGIFVGKGIYDIHVLHQLLYRTFPENTVLSHDLLESCYARCAFASGVKLMDSFPSSVEVYFKREHRWIRGDWQLLPWLFGKSPIGGLSRWKIFDNLRRSITSVCSLFAVMVNVFLLPDIFYLWVPVVFFSAVFQIILTIFNIVFKKVRYPMLRVAFCNVANTLHKTFNHAILNFILMPYRSWIAADAIVRTLYRLAVSKKRLLQWQTAETVEKSIKNTLSSYCRAMWMVVFPAVAMGLAGFFMPAPIGVKVVAVLTGLLWLSSPVAAYTLSRPLQTSHPVLSRTEKEFMRLQSRRIWQYFKDFAIPQNNWLCPDNYQLSPSTKITMKTSPTNIGLQLLSLLSSRDLGYTGLVKLVDDCENILYTLAVLPKWNGHLYNWYNIKTLEVLPPHYISTVDSGNFIGYMITLKNGLLALQDELVFSPACVEGIRDVILLSGCDVRWPEKFDSVADFIHSLRSMRESLENSQRKPWEEAKWVDALIETCDEFLHDEEELGTENMEFYGKRTLRTLSGEGVEGAVALVSRLEGLIDSIENLIQQTDFTELFNPKRLLFHIGYHVSSQTLDTGHYDLFASEALLTSFIAIARGQAPQKHWMKLGRPLAMVRGIPAFVSWSGTMFEYMMPNLVLRDYPGSALYQTHCAAVYQQRLNARKMKIPWGFSESQYFCFDTDSNYQYKAFGISRLRLQPSMDEARVVAPYATFIAMPVALRKALVNLRTLRRMGAEGEYGFYEALDFNSPDAANLRPFSIVKSFMAHHLGMSLVALNNLLNLNIMQTRFHSEPMVKATEILLEEMRQTEVVSVARKGYTIQIEQAELTQETMESRYVKRTTPLYPSAHWFSNNIYSLMVTSDGDGFSSYKGIMINRWRPDIYASAGNYIYVCNIHSGRLWSTAYKPTRVKPKEYMAVFSPHMAEFKRLDGKITTHTVITISPSENLEIRNVTFINRGKNPATLEVTSYIETVMDRYVSELAHPTFNKLFIESEYLPDHSMLLSRRRKHFAEDENPYLLHMVKTDAKTTRGVEFETDRMHFLGRYGTPERPEAVVKKLPLSNRDGFSTDPILSLRTCIAVPAGHTASVSFITGICSSREEAVKLSEKYSRKFNREDVFEQFRRNCVLEMKYLDIISKQVNTFQELVGPLFYPFKPLRGSPGFIIRNMLEQNGLWRFGISGDNPIMLLRITSAEETGIVKDVLKAYEYMRINRIVVDLVVLVEQESGYYQDLYNILLEKTSKLKIYEESSGKPSLFILQAWNMIPAEIDLLITVARIVFTSNTGVHFRKVHEQLEEEQKMTLMSTKPRRFGINEAPVLHDEDQSQTAQSEFFNGFGGFVDDGKEYEILLNGSNKLPAPWINVIANDHFGFHVSETGSGYTWSINSRENKITSWSNDPVIDLASEAIYIRDADTGAICMPASLGTGQEGIYRIRHGFGYSVFEHNTHELELKMTMYVPTDEPVKLWMLTLYNTSQSERHLVVTLFVELVLGVSRAETAPYIVTSYDAEIDCFTAKNVYNNYLENQKVFLFSSEVITAYTGDRREFLGVNGSVRKPAGLYAKLSGNIGAGLDPCGVVQIMISLQPGEKKQMIFGMGQSDTPGQIHAICTKYRQLEKAVYALEQVKKYWEKQLGGIRVKSSDRALDILVNGWLLYQTTVCRIRARAAFYQCGGAYGFRDQLQDVLALLDANPEIVKKQILIACSRQFVEGDVQHWWHTPKGLGVRTRISDDLLWLPYVTAKYIRHTGDFSILDEPVPYLSGKMLEPDENEIMDIPQVSNDISSVYEHCLRAINRVQTGIHGLPLMGGGDWNDGMNHVGISGKGESVWLGWFFYSVLCNFTPLCSYKHDEKREQQFEEKTSVLLRNMDEHTWDGEWYLRAYYDDGEKLGSKENEECRIDSISQSWAVLSGGGRKDYALQALRSARRYLVKTEEGVSLLLTPPFNKTLKDPGYIKDYYPGIRENGGQYTHAAVWLAMANARVRECNTAYQLLTLLNPIHTTSTHQGSMKYAKEPYVMAADISMNPPYAGRGGWSWYTGSASWMYQAIVHEFLGITKQGEKLFIDPAIPKSFGEYTVEYRFGASLYVIVVKIGIKTDDSVRSSFLDGKKIEGNSFTLIDDGMRHEVFVLISIKQ